MSLRLSCLGNYPVLETIVTKIEITTLAAKLATIKDIHLESSSDYFVLLHVVVYYMFVNITVLFSRKKNKKKKKKKRTEESCLFIYSKIQITFSQVHYVVSTLILSELGFVQPRLLYFVRSRFLHSNLRLKCLIKLFVKHVFLHHTAQLPKLYRICTLVCLRANPATVFLFICWFFFFGTCISRD